MIVPIATVFAVIILSMIVTRVATIALTLTGMSAEVARFQARSALTTSGFTSSETEQIVGHPVRRRIISTLMLIGSAGIVSVIGGVALTFTRSTGTADAATAALVLVIGTGFLFWLMRRRPVERALSRLIHRLLRRYTDLDIRDHEALLHIHGDYTIAELQVDADDWIADKTLAEMRLNLEGVLVLGVQRDAGNYDGAPTGTTAVHAGDVLILYGHQDRIAALDVRRKGTAGDTEHVDTTRELDIPTGHQDQSSDEERTGP